MLRHQQRIRAWTLVITTLFFFSLVFVPSTNHPANAANQNILYINPPQQGPSSAATVTYQVKVSQMDPFNTWDIQVKTDPTVLNPISLTITPNTLTGNYSISFNELTNCVNG